MGHNLGLYHDFDDINGGDGSPCHMKGLMSYDMDLGTWKWSECSKKNFNPKRPGGGLRQPIGHKIACHFSQDHAMFTKILDFVHMHPN